MLYIVAGMFFKEIIREKLAPKFTKLKTKFLNLGLPFSHSLSYLHHLEQINGVNYRYNKAFDYNAFKNKKCHILN